MQGLTAFKSVRDAKGAQDMLCGCTEEPPVLWEPLRHGWYYWPKAQDCSPYRTAYMQGPYNSKGLCIAAARGASALQGPV